MKEKNKKELSTEEYKEHINFINDCRWELIKENKELKTKCDVYADSIIDITNEKDELGKRLNRVNIRLAIKKVLPHKLLEDITFNEIVNKIEDSICGEKYYDK